MVVLMKNGATATIRLYRLYKSGAMDLSSAAQNAADRYPSNGEGIASTIIAPIQKSPSSQQRLEYRYGESDFMAIVTVIETNNPYVVIVGECSKSDWVTLSPAYNKVLQDFREQHPVPANASPWTTVPQRK